MKLPHPRRSRSIKWRLVVLFLLLAAALAAVFAVGAQRTFATGWREAARPLLTDYVARLAAEITDQAGHPGPPSIERARQLTERLPITVRIDGPLVRWDSHPERRDRGRWNDADHAHVDGLDGADGLPGTGLLSHRTADGHQIRFGIDPTVFDRRQRQFGLALAAVLLITLAAYLVVRQLLKPLDDIGAGTQRFGRGDFATPIRVRHVQRPDELDQLAATMNQMADDIRRMLEAKRALLLAISHELRSPITRARLNVELLPETTDTTPQRQALLRDLQEMADLVSDLLESERLARRHAALQREPTDLAVLAGKVVAELQARHARARELRLDAASDLPVLALDAARMRLLLRNLLDNALRHGGGAPSPPDLQLRRMADGGLRIEVRDHGPGVAEDQLPLLAQAFYRPDSARTRAAGGVGLGLYLCRMVAEAHGGRLEIENARPGLRVRVVLPAAAEPPGP